LSFCEIAIEFLELVKQVTQIASLVLIDWLKGLDSGSVQTLLDEFLGRHAYQNHSREGYL